MAPSLSVPARPMPRIPAGHRTLMTWVLAAFVGLVILFLAAVAMLLIAGSTGFFGLIVGSLCATLPVPLYILLLLWIDRFEPEPAWLLTLAFCWGALVAFISAMIVNTTNGIIAEVVSQGSGESFAATVSAPIFEELLKGAALFIIFFWRKQDFDGVIDGIVYGGITALGFATTENILYYGRQAALPESSGLIAVIFMRGIMSPFLHPWLTSMTGIGFGIARESRNIFIKLAAPVIGLMTAMFLHCVWNSTATLSDQNRNPLIFLGMYFLFAVPVFFCLMAVIVVALLREGRMIRRNLKPEADDGTLPLDELKRLGSVTGRLSASVTSLMRGGLSGWNARRKFNQVATQLAFHRNRMESGTVPRDAEAAQQEALLREWIAQWRRNLPR